MELAALALFTSDISGNGYYGMCLCILPDGLRFFPVYFMRWELALPIAVIQFVFLALIVGLFAWLDRAFGAVAN